MKLWCYGFVLLILGACDVDPSPKKSSDKQALVVTYQSQLVSVSNHFEALGTAKSNASVDMTSEVSGRLKSLDFEDGQFVEKGEKIASLDQDDALAQLLSATAALAEQERELQRLEKLVVQKAASMRDLEMQKTQATLAAANLKQVQAKLNELTICAPFSGRLGVHRISVGALIQPGQIITSLDAIDPIDLDFSIPSLAIDGVVKGTSIRAYADALPNETFVGEVDALDSHIDPVTRSMLVRAKIPNPSERLIPGMLMRVTLIQHERQALMVPEESVTQRQDAHYLTVVDSDQKARLQVVEIGVRHEGLVEIVKGLQAGEVIVVRGMGFVKAGQTVKVTEAWSQLPTRVDPRSTLR
ncbi:MAG: efflux RND transporter periplasmic adaptor subunit [Zetaproteobacteria bacterium]|nr:efflux RND transporter periplasmic adaptor subunit [Zetaproteobacteria bacterium]